MAYKFIKWIQSQLIPIIFFSSTSFLKGNSFWFFRFIFKFNYFLTFRPRSNLNRPPTRDFRTNGFGTDDESIVSTCECFVQSMYTDFPNAFLIFVLICSNSNNSCYDESGCYTYGGAASKLIRKTTRDPILYYKIS